MGHDVILVVRLAWLIRPLCGSASTSVSVSASAQEQRNRTLFGHEPVDVHIFVLAGSLSIFTDITEYTFLSLLETSRGYNQKVCKILHHWFSSLV